MKISSFSTKLILIVTASLMAFSSILTIIVSNIIRNNLLFNIKTRSDLLIDDTKDAVFPVVDLLKIKRIINEIKRNKDIFYFSIYDENGNILYFYLNPKSPFKPSVLERKDLRINNFSLKFFTVKKYKNLFEKIKSEIDVIFSRKDSNSSVLEVKIPMFIKEKKIGMIQIGIKGNSLYYNLRNAIVTTISLSFVVFIFTLLFTYLNLKTMTKPINILSKVAEEISQGKLEIGVPIFHNSYELYNLSIKMQQMVWGLRERETIKDVFGKYIDKKLVDKLLREKNQLKGVKKEVVVFYIDMQDFTKFTEQTPPEEVVATLNKFFTIAIEAVLKYGGVVDKLIGDAVLAHFGAIETKKEDPQNAIMAGLEFIKELRTLNENRKKEGLLEIRAGITIHIGEVIVGNIGHQERMEFTIVGDAVNTASRMQLYNRQFNLPILLTKEIVERISNDNFKFKFVSTVNIRGKLQPIELYTIEDKDYF